MTGGNNMFVPRLFDFKSTARFFKKDKNIFKCSFTLAKSQNIGFSMNGIEGIWSLPQNMGLGRL